MAPARILFLPLSERGQLNVALAVTSALLSRPDLELHLACFADVAPRVEELRLRSASSSGSGTSLTFHELPGPAMFPAAHRNVDKKDFPHGLGMSEVKRVAGVFWNVLSPWTEEEYDRISRAVGDLISKVDPDLVVVDPFFAPAKDALQVTKPPRRQVHLVPNSLKDTLRTAGMFWQYPTSASPSLSPSRTS